MEDQEEMITPQEVMRLLKVSNNTVYRLVKEGSLGVPIRPGAGKGKNKSIRVSLKAVHAYMRGESL